MGTFSGTKCLLLLRFSSALFEGGLSHTLQNMNVFNHFISGAAANIYVLFTWQHSAV